MLPTSGGRSWESQGLLLLLRLVMITVDTLRSVTGTCRFPTKNNPSVSERYPSRHSPCARINWTVRWHWWMIFHRSSCFLFRFSEVDLEGSSKTWSYPASMNWPRDAVRRRFLYPFVVSLPMHLSWPETWRNQNPRRNTFQWMIIDLHEYSVETSSRPSSHVRCKQLRHRMLFHTSIRWTKWWNDIGTRIRTPKTSASFSFDHVNGILDTCRRSVSSSASSSSKIAKDADEIVWNRSGKRIGQGIRWRTTTLQFEQVKVVGWALDWHWLLLCHPCATVVEHVFDFERVQTNSPSYWHKDNSSKRQVSHPVCSHDKSKMTYTSMMFRRWPHRWRRWWCGQRWIQIDVGKRRRKWPSCRW